MPTGTRSGHQSRYDPGPPLSWELLSSHREQKLACSFGTTNAWRGRKLSDPFLETAVCKAELMVRSRDTDSHSSWGSVLILFGDNPGLKTWL